MNESQPSDGSMEWIIFPMPDTGYAPFTVNLQVRVNQQYDYITWIWGDDSPWERKYFGQDPNPEVASHTYTKVGVHHIHVQFHYGPWGAACGSDIEVFGGLAPRITSVNMSTPNPDTGMMLQFDAYLDNTKGRPTYIRWDWGDGQQTIMDYPDFHPVTGHQYSFPGIYYVTVFASNDVGSDSKVISVGIAEPPPPIVCTEGEDITELCWDGSIVPIQRCINNQWVATGLECPPTNGDDNGNGAEIDMMPIVLAAGAGALLLIGLFAMTRGENG